MRGQWIAKARTKHGGTPRGNRMPEYRVWGTMIDRCYNEKCERYRYYGGRGIKMCDRWRGENGFANFIADMGRRPAKGMSIDRIDNDKGYSPENCRWATQLEQVNNTRANKRIEFNGQNLTYAQWERIYNLSHGTINRRIAYGWTPENAITTPPRQMNRRNHAQPR